ncbi:MAG: CocE/NonD family hydrolase, partial [Cyclobacteriaceae bacterium]
LKDDPGSSNLPPVSIFVMGENKWRAEQEWPLSRAVPTAMHLQVDGQSGLLTNDTPIGISSQSYIFDPNNPFWDVSYLNSYPYDQRDNESRKDVLVYTSDVLAEDLEVTGEILAELFVSTSARDTDFSFTVSDVHPDGKSINVTGLDAGYLRMRYRNGSSKQELVEPNKIYKIMIGQVYTSILFKKGHQIRLVITSSKAPHYDPNPNTGSEIATETNLVPVKNTIYHSKKYPSKILLPIIPGSTTH